MLLWDLWKVRCSAVFDDAPIYVSRVVSATLAGAMEYRMAVCISHTDSEESGHPVIWSAPTGSNWKCNSNASVTDSGSGVGLIFRDALGSIIAAFSFHLDPGISPETLEMQAILMAMEEAIRLGLSAVIFETNCLP